jgi:cytochrome c oxidase assembly protein subunit 15
MIRVKEQSTPILIWLILTAFLLWFMIMLGGATRLTHSGLSIVEWKPITGVIPPLNHAEWMAEFHNYQQYPEYKLLNRDMTLRDFQFIFWMEFSHRLLGRLLGLCFFVPLIFLYKKLNFFEKKASLFLLVLGAIQGVVGWYMVKSGLVNNPFVSHYRLTAHLLIAVFIMAGIMLMIFRRLPFSLDICQKAKKAVTLTFILQILTLIYGGFVAGLKAGFMYNTFPLMAGQWLPAEWGDLTPLWLNFLENGAFVQWIHRLLALTSLGCVWYLYLRYAVARWWAYATSLQIILGVVTLVLHVPVFWGTLHQGWAVVSICFGLYYLMSARIKSSPPLLK